MTNEQRIVACVDQSEFARYVTDYAAWAAKRINAPLELLHIIDRHPEISSSDDHSGALGPNAQENLLSQLSDEDETRSKAARERGRLFLNELRQQAVTAGAPSVDVRQRLGELEETLVEQQEGVRLFVIGRRGKSAQSTQRDLGRNVERVVRALHRPILTTTDSFKVPERVLIAFDGGITTRRGIERIATSPLFAGLPIHILMSGKPKADAPRQLEWAVDRLTSAGFNATSELVPGDAESVIAQAVSDRQIDLLVMGAYHHSPLRSALFGSKTSDLLRASKSPTLLLR
ncbi:MAG: universal stress protein [Immundisolibacteraceae bacterium]|nr:universal stress protein [Immundisolibacteraceae bacterium]